MDGSDTVGQEEDEDGFDETYDELAFVPIPATGLKGSTEQSEPLAGPSQQTKRRMAIQLDDDEDTRVEDVDTTAGIVIGRGETVREDWRTHFSYNLSNGAFT